MHRFHLREVIYIPGIVLAICNFLAAEENATLLRYGFQAGKQYAFEVKIQAEFEDYDEFREGVLTYTVITAKDTQFVLRPSGSLTVHNKMHPDANIMSRGFPSFPRIPTPSIIWRGINDGITLNRRGEKIVSRELTQLPYLLGDMELLVFETFPAEAKSSWNKQREVEVVERDSSGPFPQLLFAGPRMGEGKHTTANEQIDYSVLKKEKDSLEISKKYSLRSIPEENKPSRFEMTGEGQFTFDLTEGVIRSLSMKYECRLNETNTIRRVPFSLTYRMLSVDEMAQRQKKAEEARAAAAKAREPKPFESGERALLLKELKSADTRRLQEAAKRLARTPLDDDPADISKALAALLRNSDQSVQKSAAEALVVWVTPEAENALIKTSQSEDVFLRTPSIEALGKLKSAKAAKAVAAQMHQMNSRDEASKSLKNMGPVAEEATIPLLNDQDRWVRREACGVLGEIGGKKSLKALQAFLPKASFPEDDDAKKAISAIELRLDSPAEDNKEPEEQKTKSSNSARKGRNESAAIYRNWRDTSGASIVNAAMVSLAGPEVVLKKKDGKTIRVSIANLSFEDKKYVIEHARDVLIKSDIPLE